MRRSPSIPFLVIGVASVVIGAIALLGWSVPIGDLGKWAVPVVLLALGVGGLVRQLAKTTER